MSAFTAYVYWPSAPLTDHLVRHALAKFEPQPQITASLPPSGEGGNLLQWATYDALDHDRTLFRNASASKILTCAYTIRKALIRKHFLSRCTHHYVVKNPTSVLEQGVPKTWEMELSFIDELEEMWSDELWDLGEVLDKADTWMILKPGMADRGMGIRLFHTKEELEAIFQEFEDADSDQEADEDEGVERPADTSVAISQLRHFVIQEYLSNPLLLDPKQVPLDPKLPVRGLADLQGHKFHMRVYCVASGALQVYFYDRILALFSSAPYTSPFALVQDAENRKTDLSAHLTNTCLQTDKGEAGVRLLDELVGCHVLSKPGVTGLDAQFGQADSPIFTEQDVANLKDQIAGILGDTFLAALGMSVHFQPTPNAFELFGTDFLVSHVPASLETPTAKFQVSMLEVNAEPAIEFTGPRLTWILEDLFAAIGKVCVQPFFDLGEAEAREPWKVGQTREHLRKCLDIQVRGVDGW